MVMRSMRLGKQIYLHQGAQVSLACRKKIGGGMAQCLWLQDWRWQQNKKSKTSAAPSLGRPGVVKDNAKTVRLPLNFVHKWRLAVS